MLLLWLRFAHPNPIPVPEVDPEDWRPWQGHREALSFLAQAALLGPSSSVSSAVSWEGAWPVIARHWLVMALWPVADTCFLLELPSNVLDLKAGPGVGLSCCSVSQFCPPPGADTNASRSLPCMRVPTHSNTATLPGTDPCVGSSMWPSTSPECRRGCSKLQVGCSALLTAGMCTRRASWEEMLSCSSGPPWADDLGKYGRGLRGPALYFGPFSHKIFCFSILSPVNKELPQEVPIEQRARLEHSLGCALHLEMAV